MNEETIEKIDSLITGTSNLKLEDLSSEERAEYEKVKLLSEVIRIRNIGNQKEILDKLEQSHIQKTKNTLGFRNIPIRRIAAVLFLVVGCTLVFKINKVDFDPSEYAIHNSLRSQNTNSTLNRDQITAYNLFLLEKYDEAIPLLQNLSASQNDTISQYYLALSYYALGDNRTYKVEIQDLRVRDFKKPE